MSHSKLTAQEKTDDVRALTLFSADKCSKDRTACLNFADSAKDQPFDFAPGDLGRLEGVTFSSETGAVHAPPLKILHQFVQGNSLKLCKIFGQLPALQHTILRVEDQLKALSDRLDHFKLTEDAEFDAVAQRRDIAECKSRTAALAPVETDLGAVKARVTGLELLNLDKEVDTLRSHVGSLQGMVHGSGDEDNLGLVEDLKNVGAQVAAMTTSRASIESLITLEAELGGDLRRRILDTPIQMTALQSAQTRHNDRLGLCEAAIDVIKPQLASKASIEDLEAASAAAPEGSTVSSRGVAGANKPPLLRSMEQTEFRAFRHQFVTHAKVHRWTDEVAKQQLMLSLHTSVHAPLAMAIPPHVQDTISLEGILILWDERICPEALRSLAITQLSNLKQDLNESDINYLTRGQQLYMRARKTDNRDDPETDTRFIVDLIQGLRDKRKIPHIRREEPQTITALRTLINKENVINELDSTLDSSIAHMGPAASSPTKGSPGGCVACRDASHVVNKCPRIAAFARKQKADQVNHDKQVARQATFKKFKSEQDGNNNRQRAASSGGRSRGKKRLRLSKESYGEDKAARTFKQEKPDFAKN